VLDHPEGLAGVIAAAPFLRRAFFVPAWKLAVSLILSILWPGFTASNEVNPDHLSADPRVAAAYRADPLIHDRATVRLYTELLAAQAAVQAGAGRLNLPLLLLHSDVDRLAAPEATQLFYQNVNRDLCRYHHYENVQHELLNEPDSEVVFRDMEAWVSGVRGRGGRGQFTDP
jgi:alpha-beta hydrolase superfamily lysophospholipase